VITLLLLCQSFGLLLQLVALLLQNRIILLQRINPSLQKVDLIQSLQGSLLESLNLLQLLLFVRRELQILANLSKTFRLISDLLR